MEVYLCHQYNHGCRRYGVINLRRCGLNSYSNQLKIIELVCIPIY